MRRLVRRATSAHIRFVSPVPVTASQGLVAEVYGQLERDFGMLAPPISLHSPAPQLLAAAWTMLRETMFADGRVSRAWREATAVAVSLGNTCPYCVDVHSTMLYGLSADAGAVTGDRLDRVGDPELRAVAEWARAGLTRDTVRRSPLGAGQFAELLGVVTTFHYLNRMVNLFLRPSPFPDGVADKTRSRLRRLIGLVLAGRSRAVGVPGTSFDLLPVATLPDDLSWAAGAAHVAEAFARAAAAVDAAGRRAVPEPVLDLLAAELATWDGRPRGLSRAWAEELITSLAEPDRVVARIALLAAFASYQLDDAVVQEFRRNRPDDAALIEVASWASLAAARQVAAWSASAWT